MDFSTLSLRSVQMWLIWQAHNLIEQFWKILKSVLAIGLMGLRGNGLYTSTCCTDELTLPIWAIKLMEYIIQQSYLYWAQL